MKPRRIARELAVIVLSQLPKKKGKIDFDNIETLLTNSVASLTDYAKQLLEESSAHMQTAAAKLDEYEMNHPTNAGLVHKMTPVDVSSVFLREHLVSIDRALNMISEAIVIPELTLAFNKEGQSEIRAFSLELVNTYVENQSMVTQITKDMKSKWRSDRMMSTDLSILNLAVTELFFMPEIPCPVCINEAVELCHRFADKRAAKYLNGVLADLVDEAEYFRQTGELKPNESNSKTSGKPVA